MAASHPALIVSYESTPLSQWLEDRDDVLAIFEFGQSPLLAKDPRHVPVALEQLDQEPSLEVWRCHGPVHTGHWHDVAYAQGKHVTMGHIALDETGFDDIQSASRHAYERLQGFLQQSPHHWPLKIWHYIPAINQGQGDQERYRQFCIGRAEAISTDPGDRPAMPAATAIGTPENEKALQIYFLSAALPGLHVENPRQVSAWQYPRQYGPRSPLFSRGSIMQINGSRQFLISGTASVVGHETHHKHCATNQLQESFRNVHSLLSEGERLLANTQARLDTNAVVKIYVRDRSYIPEIQAALKDQLPADTPCILLQGDICREDLLTEVDGLVQIN